MNISVKCSVCDLSLDYVLGAKGYSREKRGEISIRICPCPACQRRAYKKGKEARQKGEAQ